MITRLFGPDLVTVSQLPAKGLVYIDDHIGHDEDTTAFDHLNTLLYNSECRVVLEYASAACVDSSLAHRVMCLPLQTYHTSYVMSKLVPRRETNNKYSIFNFCLNKIRRNRQYLLQKLTAQQLITHNYSVNWSTDPRFPNRYFMGGESDKKANNINNGAWSNLDNFESYLRPAVYEPTWISVITEPGWQAAAAFVDRIPCGQARSIGTDQVEFLSDKQGPCGRAPEAGPLRRTSWVTGPCGRTLRPGP